MLLALCGQIKMVPGLLPMLIEGQDFIDKQDELSVLEFMDKYGMPRRISGECLSKTPTHSNANHNTTTPVSGYARQPLDFINMRQQWNKEG